MDHMSTIQFASLIGMFFTLLLAQLGAIYFLSTRIDTMGTRLDGRIDRISDDMRQFYRTLGQHDGRLDAVEKRVH